MAELPEIPLPADCNVAELLNRELLLTDAETARCLRLSVEGVKNLCRMKRLAGVSVGKTIRFRPTDIRKFVDGLNGGGV